MMYCIGAVFLISGIMILVKVIKGDAVSVLWEVWLGILFSLMGTAMIVLAYGAGRFWQDYTVMIPLLAGLGLLAYSIVAQNVWRMMVCNQKIMAGYKGCRTNYNHRVSDTYTPIFSFEWEGEMYHNILSGYSCSKREIKGYCSGSQYEIYLNPYKPRMIQTSRRLRGENILMLVVGTVFLSVLFTYAL